MLKYETELKAETFDHKGLAKMDCYFKNGMVMYSKGNYLDGLKCGFV